ncbi:MAG TPA: A24 family peptidase [Candidatus Dormibacteraeota bacterium]|nr:A24 family peptidase [Candidatus Dormibacteraeota bacterium]
MMTLLAGALIFGCAAVCGIVLATLYCARFTPFEDGPKLGPARPAALVAGAVVLGIAMVARHAPLLELGLSALLCVPLAAAWYSDAAKGIVPDVFTLGPLAVVAVYVVVHHSWWVGLSAIVPFVPFAIAAMFSKGRGMGWGDAKLVALGGAVLGMQTAVLAFAVACFVATVVAVVRDRGKTAVAFAPYLVASIVIAMVLQVHG